MIEWQIRDQTFSLSVLFIFLIVRIVAIKFLFVISIFFSLFVVRSNQNIFLIEFRFSIFFLNVWTTNSQSNVFLFFHFLFFWLLVLFLISIFSLSFNSYQHWNIFINTCNFAEWRIAKWLKMFRKHTDIHDVTKLSNILIRWYWYWYWYWMIWTTRRFSSVDIEWFEWHVVFCLLNDLNSTSFSICTKWFWTTFRFSSSNVEWFERHVVHDLHQMIWTTRRFWFVDIEWFERHVVSRSLTHCIDWFERHVVHDLH